MKKVVPPRGNPGDDQAPGTLQKGIMHNTMGHPEVDQASGMWSHGGIWPGA